MQEKTILKTSLIVVLVGLAFLFFYAEEIDLKAINNVDESNSGESIKLTGTISKLTTSDKVAFIELEGQQTIKTDVILFSSENVYLQEGDYVEIYGTVEEYNSEKEIIASKIVKK
ncbi:hypothetical protein HOE37_05245 [Candidatus Woesearchaeota archaeon]|nr:hypothetical protein [Candidatus Woesearchaeota archaeon]MBT4111237.1 hypothetical protein [Candidatus Woesearchaeota archaeon]MBT4336817.1 hypothetical protein [Candidatus Woesearchaeota archaeon]MBT4469485.1 hypothetical protein [Candidatus Woesearchaeota archaeon]MBT6744120.1 hypothetical protein [Candidatus Woesearchaeota archaeon]